MADAKPSIDCLIHCTDEKTTITSLRDLDSWYTLLNAAEIREYLPVLRYKEVEGIPEITYHPKCRKIFTMKRDLQVIKSSKSTDDTELCSNKRSTLRGRHLNQNQNFSEILVFEK